MDVIYTLLEGERIDLSTITQDDRTFLGYLWVEYASANSWQELQQRTAHATIERAKRIRGDVAWGDDPFFRIQVDLVARVSIETGEFQPPSTKIDTAYALRPERSSTAEPSRPS